MLAISRQPRLLVKTIGSAPQAFKIAETNLDLKPLFQSIHQGLGLSAAAQPNWYLASTPDAEEEVNSWDLCHQLLRSGFGLAGAPAVEFAEPDLEQKWVFGTEVQHAFSLAKSCDRPSDPDSRLPLGTGFFWYRDDAHSELEKARNTVGVPTDRIRIGHFDTGFDPNHSTKPQFLRTDLQKNFVEGENEDPNSAVDDSGGLLNNLGHGTGTLGLLAGASVAGVALGGAPFLDVVPVRVANSVVLFRNSAIAKAFDYVHSLLNSSNRVHVITMSMGGLASQAWAEAVNALYDSGVFIVTAAGNNFGNLPTHNIVYPARFKRVVAACGVMADGKPYADLPLNIMAGNYGPDSKMSTALAAFTPNTPWAKLGCSQIVDHDGRGTSSATPQVAAAAALWLQQFKNRVAQYSQGWMAVEAVRKALADSARLDSPQLRQRLGNGIVHAQQALAQQPAPDTALKKQPEDSASFPFLRVITGLGLTGAPPAQQKMLELEGLQLLQMSHELEQLLPDPEVDPEQIPVADRPRIIEMLMESAGASNALRKAIGGGSGRKTRVVVPGHSSIPDPKALALAMRPPVATPASRRLRVFAFDPLLGTRLETFGLNQTTLTIQWEEDLQPGPTGEYIEVVDIDPASGCCYAPIDLTHPALLSQDGLPPSEGIPQYHQQMCYAVAMKTIEHFERALGRVALWAPKWVPTSKTKEKYVQRLRIYPHAMREANSFYSPNQKALLLGYFPASQTAPGDNLPGGIVFCSLSHDIIAHETTHALLDGLHRRFREPTNPDVLAFHEAFADIVALFQHFTLPEALRHQISLTGGDLRKQNMLGELAQQFGEAIARFGALRSAIGGYDENQKWIPADPSPADYENTMEPHERGAILVAAVFDAFLAIYKERSADLIRLATGGTGILPEGGAISYDLVNRLAEEASKAAGHVLNICIRALDYCPPVDLTFGEYLRALITADLDLVPDDPMGYRVAFIQAFRRRGIYPRGVRSLSVESLRWDNPGVEINLDSILDPKLAGPEKAISLAWDLRANRRGAFWTSRNNARRLHDWFLTSAVTDSEAESLGFSRVDEVREVNGVSGKLSKVEVHSVRPVRRVGPDGQQRMDLVVEITQSWTPSTGIQKKFRGGCTLIVDLDTRGIRYCIRKRVASPARVSAQQSFQAAADYALRENYFDEPVESYEPFAMLHRGL